MDTLNINHIAFTRTLSSKLHTNSAINILKRNMFQSQQKKPPWFTFTLQAVLSLCWQWWARCFLTRSVTGQAWRGTRCWSRSTTKSRWWRWRPRTATRSCHMTSRSPQQYTTLYLIRSVIWTMTLFFLTIPKLYFNFVQLICA